jgi:hypothetical protein
MSYKNKIFRILSALILVSVSIGFAVNPAHAASQASTTPTIEILRVVRNQSVSIEAYNFPANDALRATMGPSGGQGVDDVVVGTIPTNRSGFAAATLNIPQSLMNTERLVIRLQSPTTGFFAFNTFANTTYSNGSVKVPPPVFDTRTSDSVSKQITYQQPADIWRGNAGVFLPSSSFTGRLVLTQARSNAATAGQGLDFVQRLVDFRILDNKGAEFRQVFGLVYVYFNLNKQTRAAWEAGELSIYHYDTRQGKWVQCPTHLVQTRNLPHGRLTCYAGKFGTYGLVYQP